MMMTPPKVSFCDVCFGRLHATSNGQKRHKHCAPVHAAMRARQSAVEAHVPKRFDCKECGKKCVTEYGDKRSAFCSKNCAARHDGRKYGRNHRQRAKRAGVDYEPIDVADIYQRDGWKCGICGGRIDRRTKAPHPRSASLDHIVPLSKGGGHVRRNVQAVHLACNTLKGNDAVGSQLLLIG